MTAVIEFAFIKLYALICNGVAFNGRHCDVFCHILVLTRRHKG